MSIENYTEQHDTEQHHRDKSSDRVLVVDDIFDDQAVVDSELFFYGDFMWSYNNGSTEEDKDSVKFFFARADESFKAQSIFDNFKLEMEKKNILRIDANPLEVFVNGQTYGLDGSLHMDNSMPYYYTLLYMVNSGDTSDIGDFLFQKPGEDETTTIDFKPGRFILFPSCWKHTGLAPKVKNKFRMTLAYKSMRVTFL